MNLYRIENMIGIDWVHSQYVPIKLVVFSPLASENRKVGIISLFVGPTIIQDHMFFCFFNGNKLGKIDIYDMKIDITP